MGRGSVHDAKELPLALCSALDFLDVLARDAVYAVQRRASTEGGVEAYIGDRRLRERGPRVGWRRATAARIDIRIRGSLSLDGKVGIVVQSIRMIGPLVGGMVSSGRTSHSEGREVLFARLVVE